MSRPSDHELLRRVCDLPLTYPETGATAAPHLPLGYRHIDRSLTVGSGAAVYERAGAGLFSWHMHRRAGIKVVASTPRAATGSCAVLFVGRLLIGSRTMAITAPCRVVYV